MTEHGYEAVFVARREADEAAVERVLHDAGIRWATTLDAVDAEPGAVCYLGLIYTVPHDLAAQSRELLVRSGLGSGVVEERRDI